VANGRTNIIVTNTDDTASRRKTGTDGIGTGRGDNSERRRTSRYR